MRLSGHSVPLCLRCWSFRRQIIGYCARILLAFTVDGTLDGVTNLVVYEAAGLAVKVFSPFLIAVANGTKHCVRVLYLLNHMEATVVSSLLWYGMQTKLEIAEEQRPLSENAVQLFCRRATAFI